MRKERNKSKIWRTPKEKFGLSEISFHVRCLLNSDCSLSRVLYGQVSVLEVLWETVQWCTHWNQGHLWAFFLSLPQTVTMETHEDSSLWYAWHKLDIEVYVIFFNLKLLIQGMFVKNISNDLGAGFSIMKDQQSLYTTFMNPLASIPHGYLFKIIWTLSTLKVFSSLPEFGIFQNFGSRNHILQSIIRRQHWREIAEVLLCSFLLLFSW